MMMINIDEREQKHIQGYLPTKQTRRKRKNRSLGILPRIAPFHSLTLPPLSIVIPGQPQHLSRRVRPLVQTRRMRPLHAPRAAADHGDLVYHHSPEVQGQVEEEERGPGEDRDEAEEDLRS